jgi:hypothetical protein
MLSLRDRVVRKHSMFVGRSQFFHRMIGEVIDTRWRTMTPGQPQVRQVLVKYQTATGGLAESWIRDDLLEVYTGAGVRIETKLEEPKAPVTHTRYAVIVDPVFDVRGEFDSYVSIEYNPLRTIFRTREKAEESAQLALKQKGVPHVVIQFISRFSNPPVPKIVKEDFT